ncbi:MAG: bifunctional tetrahydrofolate synthase/dihydrofolate synthase [Burkholderiales bacterium]
MSRPATPAGWLAYLETLHPKPIALGLDRVRAVRARMDAAIACPVVTVAGTNGKGSTCALIESMLRCAGYRTGLYTSPHLLRYHERVRIAGREATDDDLLAAFNAVEDARAPDAGDPVPLTYFEFGTLAALWLFARAGLDALVLEVGLGGRLDAVNVVDPDVAVVTSVAIDHVDYLGATREDIGREKAGIFRARRPAVCADPAPPATVIATAERLGADLVLIGRDYGATSEGTQWRYRGPRGDRYGLPFPALRGACQLANAATALVVLDLLHARLPVAAGAVRDGLLNVALPGRFQVLPGRPATVLDVAHNPHAAHALAAALGDMGYFPATIAVFGMLADKDIDGVVAQLRSRVDRWHVATLPGPRGAGAARLRDALAAAGVDAAAVRAFDDVAGALAAAREAAGEADRIVVFGSFLTVAAALRAPAR